MLNSPYNLAEANGRVSELIRLVQMLPGNQGVKITREYLFEGVPLWKLAWGRKNFDKIRKFLNQRLQERNAV